MVNDKAMEYNAKVIKIERTIEILESIGLDTKDYKVVLNTIESTLNEEHKTKLKDKYFGIELDYTSAISKLNYLESELNEYEIYFKAYSFCNHVTDILKNINKNNITEYIDKVIELLTEMKLSNTLVYTKEKQVLEGLYTVTYYLLLYEKMLLNTTKLYDYVRQNEIDLCYLDKLLINDIKPLNNDKLNSIINLYNSNGINTHYIEEEILSEILSIKYNYNITNEITKKLDVIKKEILNNIKQINKKEKDRFDIEYNFENLDKSIKYGKKEVKASVLSLIAGIALLGGPTFGIIKLFPPYDDKIPTTKTIYIEDGSSETIDDGYAWKSSIFNDDKNARLKKYYPYEKTKLGNFQRKVEYKNLKIDSTKDIEDNLSIVDISDMVDSTCIQTKDSLNIDDFYTEPYMQIEVTNYDYDNSVKDIRKSFLILEIIAITLFYAIITSISNSINYGDGNHLYLMRKIKNLIRNIEYLKEKLDDKKERKLDIIKINAEIMGLLANNEALLNEYKKIYNKNYYNFENISKITEPTELENKLKLEREG